MRNFWIVLVLLFLLLILSKVNDGGWQLVGFPDKVVNAMGIHPSDPQVLYVIVRDTPYKTVDGGSDWSALLSLYCQICMSIKISELRI